MKDYTDEKNCEKDSGMKPSSCAKNALLALFIMVISVLLSPWLGMIITIILFGVAIGYGFYMAVCFWESLYRGRS